MTGSSPTVPSAVSTVAGETGRARVLVVDPIDPGALDELRRRFDLAVELAPDVGRLRLSIAEADALVMRSGIELDAETIAAAGRLKVVARAGVGTDNIDFEAARAASIQVFNVPDRSSNAVAEFALGMILAVGRKLALADSQVRRDEWRKAELAGLELRGATIGIVGLGRIGSRLAELALALGMRVLATVARPGPDRRRELGGRGIELVELGDLLARSDVVCLTLPLTPRNVGMIGAAELRAMRPGAYLVNVSRAELVEAPALIAALRQGRLGGGAFDVLDRADCRELAAMDDVVLTPHIGAMTASAQAEIGRLVVAGLGAGLNGEEVPGRLC